MKMFLKFMIICLSIYWRVSVVNTWNIPIPDPINDPIHAINKVTVKMLTNCYADHKEILVHSQSNRFTIKSIQDTGSLATIMSPDLSTTNNHTRVRLHMNLFVMTPRSVPQFKGILVSFKRSPHWNIKAPFFILDNSNNKCKNAREMLEAAWKMNVIKSFFLCVNNKLIPMIYTYNPYTNRAPQPWQKVTKLPSGWTMYTRRSQIKKICAGLNFARTEHLDGSVIRVGVDLFDYTNLDESKTYDESIMDRMFSDMAFEATEIKRFFNATLSFIIGPTKKLYGCAKTGQCDVCLMLSIDPATSYTVRYQHYYIVSNRHSSYTLFNDIQRYYDVITLLLMCIVLLITFFAIVFTGNRRRWFFAGLEILRLLINKTMSTRIDRIVLKIFFCSVLLYFIVMQAIFFGNLSAVLTHRQPPNNPETMEDLKDSQYDPILVPWTVKPLINDPILEIKTELSSFNCVPELLARESAVCIYSPPKKMKSVLKSKFHISKRPVFETKSCNPHRDDWPLLDRFNKFLKTFETHGYSLADIKNIDEKTKKALDAVEEITTPRIHYNPISIKMLNWAFIFFLIGMVLSIIFWICERRRKNLKRVKIQPPEEETQNSGDAKYRKKSTELTEVK